MKRLPYSLCFILMTFVKMFFNLCYKVMSDGFEEIFVYICLIDLTTSILFLYFCMAKRLKDSGRNQYLAWLGIVPLIGCFYALYMCFPASKTPDGFTGTFKQKKGLQDGKLEWNDK